MAEKPTEKGEKLNTLVTDVAVIKSEMTHLTESNKAILTKLDNMTYVQEGDFETYKTYVEKTYVPRSEVESILKAWHFATGTVGKLLIFALVSLAMIGAVGTMTETQLIQKLRE